MIPGTGTPGTGIPGTDGIGVIPIGAGISDGDGTTGIPAGAGVGAGVGALTTPGTALGDLDGDPDGGLGIPGITLGARITLTVPEECTSGATPVIMVTSPAGTEPPEGTAVFEEPQPDTAATAQGQQATADSISPRRQLTGQEPADTTTAVTSRTPARQEQAPDIPVIQALRERQIPQEQDIPAFLRAVAADRRPVPPQDVLTQLPAPTSEQAAALSTTATLAAAAARQSPAQTRV